MKKIFMMIACTLALNFLGTVFTPPAPAASEAALTHVSVTSGLLTTASVA